MTGVTVPLLQTLRLENLTELAGSPPPCITILLPPYRPGEQTKSMAALLRTYCQDIERQLAASRLAEREMSDLIQPLLRLIEAPDFAAGSHWGRAIFRSPEVFAVLEEITVVQPRLTIASCFEVRGVLADLYLSPEFFLLKLSQKQVELLRCAGRRAQRLDLPKGVPRTLEEALAFEPPDHDLENRSAAGSSIGSMRGVRFGTGSGRETARVHVADFFKAVDRGIKELAHGRDLPLVLTGVDEDAVIYRSVSGYPHLLKDSIHGGANTPLPEHELLQQAYALVRSDSLERAVGSLYELKERKAPARFSTDLDTILRAAAEGRVGWLFINQDARVLGVSDMTRRPGQGNWGEEDLLNVAAVETILHRGEAFTIPDAKMPDGAEVAAVFRY